MTCPTHLIPSATASVPGEFLTFGFDFYAFLAGARLFLTGRNPYDCLNYFNEMEAVGRAISSPLPFPYPPNLFLILAPFVPWNPVLAAAAWGLLTATILLGVVGWTKSVGNNKVSALSLGMLLLIFPSTGRLLMYGQLAGILLGLWIFAVLLLDRNRFFMAGAILSLTTIKPQLAVVPLLVIGLHMLKEARFAWFGGLVGGILLQILISWACYPAGLTAYAASLHYIIEMHQKLSLFVYSFSPWPETVFLFNTYLLPVTAIVYACFLGQRQDVNLRHKLVVALCLAICATPYLWLHDGALLLPAFLLLCGKNSTLAILITVCLAFLWVAADGFLLVTPWDWTVKLLAIALIPAYQLYYFPNPKEGSVLKDC